jgi:hypothetical protein
MNKRILSKFIKNHFLPAFPGFTLNKAESDMFIVPMNHLYRAFVFAGSSYSTTSFRVNAAIMPLYVPAEFYHVTFGERMKHGNNDTWEWSETEEQAVSERLKDAMVTQGMPRLGKIQSPLDFARTISSVKPQKTVNRTQAIAYSLIYAGVYDEGLQHLRELCKELESFNGSAPWDIEKRDRNKELCNTLEQNPQQAKELLVEWEKQSIKNLKLDGYPN